MEIPQALSDFSFVLVYLVAEALFAMGPLIIAKLIAPRSYGAARDAVYECGIYSSRQGFRSARWAVGKAKSVLSDRW